MKATTPFSSEDWFANAIANGTNHNVSNAPITLDSLTQLCYESTIKWGDAPTAIKMNERMFVELVVLVGFDPLLIRRRKDKEREHLVHLTPNCYVLGMDIVVDNSMQFGDVRMGRIVRGEFVEHFV